MTEGGKKRFGDRVEKSLSAVGIETRVEIFEGECSIEEVERLVGILRATEVDSAIAVGGGKCIDAAKCVAFRLGVQAVICPTDRIDGCALFSGIGDVQPGGRGQGT